MRPKIARMCALVIVATCLLVLWLERSLAESVSVRVGWIGAMSGSVAKYGAYQAAQIALDDVNTNGGVNGKKLELLFQDGKCNSVAAVSAANQLINFEKVKFIVGGHCSPESIPVAALAEKAKVIQIAAITSSPKLTNAGDYIFRVTAPNIDGAKLLVAHAHKNGRKRLGVVYEETEYAQGLADFFRSEAIRTGIEVPYFEGFAPGENDLRNIITKIKSMRLDAVYLSPQSPDSTLNLLKLIRGQKLEFELLANEIAGNTVGSMPEMQSVFEGVVFAEPEFDRKRPEVISLASRYKERFNSEMPYGFYTAEAYDAVRVMAHVISKCGENTDDVKRCLYALSDYQGISGRIAFDKNGDGIRHYVLKQIHAGEVVPYASRIP